MIFLAQFFYNLPKDLPTCIKAKEVFRLTGLPSIADDTGLEVDALNGKPGVFTARFAGENCSYMDNVNKMLKVMKNIKLLF